MRVLVVSTVVVLIIAAASGVYFAGALGGWWIGKRDLDGLVDTLSPYLEVRQPEGEGPFPVVLHFPGCGGKVGHDGRVSPVVDLYADEALERGVGVIVVDSMRPRGLSRRESIQLVCSGQRLRGAQRAGDALAAMAYARTLDWVDQDRIAMSGWSHGAWAVMDLMTMDLVEDLPHGLSSARPEVLDGLAAMYLTYPYTGFPSRAASGEPWLHQPLTHVVIAADDKLATPQDIEAAITVMRNSGVPVTSTTIPNVTHAFDEPDLEPGSTFQSAPEAAVAAREAYGAWLAQALGAETGAGTQG